jgi:hypothetical protein
MSFMLPAACCLLTSVLRPSVARYIQVPPDLERFEQQVDISHWIGTPYAP